MKSRVIVAVMLLMLVISLQSALLLPAVNASPHIEINAAKAYSMIYSNTYPNLVIIDVRAPGDYNAGHVPGAINLMVSRPSSSSPWNFDNVTAWINSPQGQGNKTNEIIVYCVSGTRSHATSNYLETNGFTKVFDMGAYSGWSALITAVIDIKPDTLNLDSEGKWVTCYIELPTPNSVNDIVVSAIIMNNVVYAESKPTEIGDYDGDTVPDLMIKFDRTAVQDLLYDDEIRLCVTFGLSNGKLCGGWDSIRVIG